MPLPQQYWWSEQDEQKQFLEVLQHDRKNGNVIRLTLGQEDNPEPRHFASKDLKKVMYTGTNKNAYVSLNSFKGYKRKADQIWNYSGIYIDLDGHDFTDSELFKAISRTKDRIGKAVDDKKILMPTMMTSTGRGLGIYYIFERSIANVDASSKAIRFMDDIKKLLIRKYSEILSGKGLLEVDVKVQDPARVVRMPGTYNIKARRNCSLLFVGRDKADKILYYSLNDIVKGNHLEDYFEKRRASREEMRKKKVVYIDAYRLPFLTLRMQKLKSLQELREYDCHGFREYMCFIYYNAAVQVYGHDDGMDSLRSFNDAFNEPIADKEIEHIIKVVENNKPSYGNYEGYYKLPDNYILETLEITEVENKICRFGQSKRQIENEQKKAKHKAEKIKRNNEILDYIIANPDVKYDDIASSFGVSEKTVRRIANANNVYRHKAYVNKVADNTPGRSGQNFTESLVGVPSCSSRGNDLPTWSVEITQREDLLTAYRRLYTPVIQELKDKRQIVGQLSFRTDPDGNIVFYEYGKRKDRESSYG